MTSAPVPTPPLKPLRTNPTPIALRLSDAARTVGLSVRSIQRLIAAGELKASRLGRSVVVETRELERLLARNRIGGAA